MKRPRRTQAQRREETREQVLGAAARLFARHGFGGTSLDAIAEEAGFSRGAVYYNFADKEELFLALLDRRCQERGEALRRGFSGADTGDPGELMLRARQAADEAFAATAEDLQWRALSLEFLAHAARDAAFRRRLARRTAEMSRPLTELVVDRAEPYRDVLGMEPEQLAAVIDALGAGLATHRMLHGRDAVPDGVYSAALGLIFDGVLARAGDGAELVGAPAR